MGQFGFFDADRRLAALTAKRDPLEMIARVVPFDSFRSEIEAAVLTPASEKKSTAGRKPIDVMVMFRMLVLQSLYNLSDEQVEYQVRDRLSFTRFLGLGIEDGIPDGTTLWLFRETLAKAGLVEKLFERFGQHLEAKGYIARGGQMVDATIVPVPKQRNSRDENDEVKAGKTPEAWQKNPAKNRQKDKDARWTNAALSVPRRACRPALRGQDRHRRAAGDHIDLTRCTRNRAMREPVPEICTGR
jgi:hypothetical protein